jgi:hypothetical protein
MRIPYKTKVTQANTTYRELRALDRNLVLDKAQEIIDLDNELKKYNSPDSITLNSPNPNMPRMSPPYGKGRNSARSMCEGIINNMRHGTQYDLSDKSMDGLAESFRVAHSIVDSFEQVIFYEVDEWPKKEVPAVHTDTFLDLFEVDTIIFKRKV